MRIAEAMQQLWKQTDSVEYGGEDLLKGLFTDPKEIVKWLGEEMAEELLPKAEHLADLTYDDLKAADDEAASKLEGYRLKLALEYEAIQRALTAKTELYNKTEIPADFRWEIERNRRHEGRTL